MLLLRKETSGIESWVRPGCYPPAVASRKTSSRIFDLVCSSKGSEDQGIEGCLEHSWGETWCRSGRKEVNGDKEPRLVGRTGQLYPTLRVSLLTYCYHWHLPSLN